MQIQIDTGPNIEGSNALSVRICEVVTRNMTHETSHITRIEVQVSDENGPKSGPNAVRRTMEARLERHQPLHGAVDAESMHQAIAGAAEKLSRFVEHMLGRQRDERKHRTD